MSACMKYYLLTPPFHHVLFITHTLLQYTPCFITSSFVLFNNIWYHHYSHYYIPKFVEFHSLEGLCKEIADHIVSWAIYQRYFTIFNSIFYEEIPDVNMVGSLTT